jgi:DMSO/TMAO reductase YedYZ molybdopterin-dependent catalytic subunit
MCERSEIKGSTAARTLTRRDLLKAGTALTVAGFLKLPASVFAAGRDEEGATPLAFLDAQPEGKMLKWEGLENWITANENVFAVSHYGVPNVTLENYSLEISGLVSKPRSLTIEELKKRRKKEVIATLECSGNSSNPAFAGAIGNVRWTGTPLASLLKEVEPKKRAIEAVFFGADEKIEKIRDKEYLQSFARSLALPDAMREDIILAWEMNGQPLNRDHGAPLRLVVPGWFGIAWVKWLNRIELLDRRYMSKYMAREYVTIRGEERNNKTIWRETSVGPMDVKSVTARALRLANGTVRFRGAAWTDGTPLKGVEIRIDKGDWQSVSMDKTHNARYAWKFWEYDWKNPAPGEHTVVSRAMDTEGRIQPSADDPEIALKRTYWEANQQWRRRIKIDA